MSRTFGAFLSGALLLASVACTSPAARAAEPTSSAPAASAPATTVVGPSPAALMVCGTTVRQSIATTLGLKALPSATTTWVDHLYTCRYDLPSGLLVLRVKEFADLPAAEQYVETLRADTAPSEPIVGLANLGLPAYRSPRGVVIFLKDGMTLEVDASRLPAPVGSQGVAPTDFAYQLATSVLACWTGH